MILAKLKKYIKRWLMLKKHISLWKGQMTKTQAIKDSIAHHKRMLAWVMKQPKDNSVNEELMLEAINENWIGAFCALCKKYYNDGYSCCKGCPLFEKFGDCDTENNWSKLDRSLTWQHWIRYDRKLIKQLESLL